METRAASATATRFLFKRETDFSVYNQITGKILQVEYILLYVLVPVRASPVRQCCAREFGLQHLEHFVGSAQSVRFKPHTQARKILSLL